MGKKLNVVKVFSATKARDREMLGDVITQWLQERPNLEILEKIVTQSSDSEFHCLAITFFCFDEQLARREVG